MSVALFTLGGTIAMTGNSGGVVSRLTGAELAAAVPGIADLGVPLDVQDTHAVPSANLTFRQVLDVVAATSSAARDLGTLVVFNEEIHAPRWVHMRSRF